MQAADGYFRILGRVDDVINVAGHRLGTKELESAALTVPEVTEAAAVPVIDDIRGRIVEMYVALKPGVAPDGMEARSQGDRGRDRQDRQAEERLDRGRHAEDQVGQDHAARIAAVSNFTDVGDVTTLANPEVVDTSHQVQSAKVAKGEQPRELSEAEHAEIAKYGQAE